MRRFAQLGLLPDYDRPWPADSVRISGEFHEEFLRGLSRGRDVPVSAVASFTQPGDRQVPAAVWWFEVVLRQRRTSALPPTPERERLEFKR